MSSPNQTLWGVSLATYMGYGPIFLVGYDLGFTDPNIDRVPLPKNIPERPRADRTLVDPNTMVPTTTEFQSYKVATAAQTLVKSLEDRRFEMAELYVGEPGNVEVLPKWTVDDLKGLETLSPEMAAVDVAEILEYLKGAGFDVKITSDNQEQA